MKVVDWAGGPVIFSSFEVVSGGIQCVRDTFIVFEQKGGGGEGFLCSCNS